MLEPLQKRWVVAPKITIEADEQLGAYPPFLRQILFNRGIVDEFNARRFLEGQGEPYDPFLLTGMQAAVERLLWAVDHEEAIAVYGDYDVDGITATALMVEVLQAFGAEAEAYIPNRFDEGYGLNNSALDALAGKGIRVVLTVDCGIRSLQEAEHADALGLDLIISDHHHPQQALPMAWTVICPKQAGDVYPDKNLAGVGVAYKIAEALFKTRPISGRSPKEWLDLVALGTVADVVPLSGENRILVRAGLNLIHLGQRAGILSLAHAAGLSLTSLTASDVSFMLAPRLNAAGRLESALQAYQLLAARDLRDSGLLAQRLDDQNRERQRLTLEMQSAAELQIEQSGQSDMLFAFDPNF